MPIAQFCNERYVSIERKPVSITQNWGVYDAIELMQKEGVRRLIVLNKNKEVCGVITTDKIMQLIGDEMGRIGELFEFQDKREEQQRELHKQGQEIAV